MSGAGAWSLVWTSDEAQLGNVVEVARVERPHSAAARERAGGDRESFSRPLARAVAWRGARRARPPRDRTV